MDNPNDDKGHQIGRANSRIWVALTLMAVGGALLLQQLGFPLPYWLFTWPTLLIVIGLFMGFNHGFRGGAWAIMIIIGGFFLIDDLLPGISFHRFVWPFAILAIGLMLLVRPRRHDWRHWDDWKRNLKDKGQWKQDWKENISQQKN
ncbi:MAG TPA: DUF5668 domain-containing protein, partial [Puia sp.]|nr:DUF5668 domain-containing protein [Puia sp.]